MSALIVGFQGQLGQALAQRLPDATTCDRASCDITRDDHVDAVLAAYEPTIVFNAAAYNLVDKAEEERDLAFAVNSAAPGRLASAARRIGAKFMHFSTDYVFGDGHDRPIDEACLPDPLSAYGRSKYYGEQLALQNSTQTFVVRTTGLYSQTRNNFVRSMLRYAALGKPLTVVDDQFVSPTWVDSLADVCLELADTDVYGVYHVTSDGGCSWYEFAGRIFEILDVKADLSAIGQNSWAAVARRPRYSVLDDAMLRATRVCRIGRWDDELEKFLAKHGDALLEEART